MGCAQAIRELKTCVTRSGAVTGKPLFGENTPDAEVAAMLLGTEQLPFEAEPRLWQQFEKYQVGPSHV